MSKPYLKKADDNETDFNQPYLKDEFQFEIADVDRYTTDKYFANLTLQETHSHYSIGFQLYNYQVGTTGSVQYWHYEKDELNKAKKTFKQVKTALTEIMRQIEYLRPPMAVITPMIRAALHLIDIPKKERSSHYLFNTYSQLPLESDWRNTLYSGHYPDPDLGTLDQIWNIDEKSKQIESIGNSPRKRILRYKQASNEEFQKLAGIEKLKNLLVGFGIPVGAGFLIWLAAQGIDLGRLTQEIEQNPTITREQIIEKMDPKQTSPPVLESVTETPKAPNQPKSTNTTFDSLDLRNIDGLEPAFAEKVKNILMELQKKGWKPRIAEGLRTVEQQQKKINDGFSQLKNPQNSKHVQGLAVDIIDSRYGWNGPASNKNFQFWLDLGEAALQQGLVWGGNWKVRDVAHVEFSPSKTGCSLKNLKTPFDSLDLRQKPDTINNRMVNQMKKMNYPNGFVKQAYDQTDWLRAKQALYGFIPQNLQWEEIVPELTKLDIPSQLIKKLYYIFIDLKSRMAHQISWHHKYS